MSQQNVDVRRNGVGPHVRFGQVLKGPVPKLGGPGSTVHGQDAPVRKGQRHRPVLQVDDRSPVELRRRFV